MHGLTRVVLELIALWTLSSFRIPEDPTGRAQGGSQGLLLVPRRGKLLAEQRASFGRFGCQKEPVRMQWERLHLVQLAVRP